MARIFISSVQEEFTDVRRALRDYVSSDFLLKEYFHVQLFEDFSARDRSAERSYRDEIAASDLYLGIFGSAYGEPESSNKSPTELEFDAATELGKERLVFVWGSPDVVRDPRMAALIHRAESQVVRRRVIDLSELQAGLYASCVEHLQRKGLLHRKPFDAAACVDARMADVDPAAIAAFLRRASAERGYPLEPSTPPWDVLSHLNLLDHGHPTHAATLLFGRNPQRHLPSSEVKFLHFHGTRIEKPMPDYKVFKGNLFTLIDEVIRYVLSKLSSAVDSRERQNAVAVTYEIPRSAIAEAIVNAVVHRDYSSAASVQVSLFSDRLEVWNPGEFPPELPLIDLRRPHASIPRNPLLAEPLYLVRLIEKAGTGTLDMISLTRKHGLPEPVFQQEQHLVKVVLFRPTAQVTAQVNSQLKKLSDNLLSDFEAGVGGLSPHPTAQVTAQVTEQVTEQLGRILEAARPGASREALQQSAGLNHREHFRKAYLEPLLRTGFLERTLPDKPTSRLQTYRLTPAGALWLERFEAWSETKQSGEKHVVR